MKTERTLPTGVKIREIQVNGATRIDVASKINPVFLGEIKDVNVIKTHVKDYEMLSLTKSDYYNELRDSEIIDANINIIAWIVSAVIICLILYFILS